MSSPVILVAGTFALALDQTPGPATHLDPALRALPWSNPHSDFAVAAKAAGLLIDSEPFVWSTALDGLAGQDKEWYAAGAALRYFAHYKYPTMFGFPICRVSIIAHSHGGQVAIYAAAQGLLIDVLATVGTPVRKDMTPFRLEAKRNTREWVHIFSRFDPVQLEGEVGGGGSPFFWPRQFPEADLMIDAETTQPNAHGKLHDPALWTKRGWWKMFTEGGAR